MTGREVPEQVEAFCDTWEMDAEKEELINNMTVTMKSYSIDEDFITFFDTWVRALHKPN